MAGVFNFNARNVIEHVVITHINVITHAHINGGIFNTTHHVIFNEAVLAKLREDTVYPGVHDPVVADRKVVARLTHDGVAFEVGNLEPLHAKAIARVQNGVI